MRIVVIAIAVTLLTGFLIPVETEASQDELALFDQGYEYYLSYQPEQAVVSFQNFLNKFPNSSVKDAVLYWLGKSQVKVQSFEAAQKSFLQLNDEIPDSPFKEFADIELKAMNSQPSERVSVTNIEQVYAEIHALRDEKAQAEKMLAELTAERDNLKALLEEEKMVRQELKARADRFDSELRDILSKLQTLQMYQETDYSRLTISQDHHGEHDSIPQKDMRVVHETAHEKGVTKNIDQGIEIQPEKQREAMHEADQKPIVARGTSSHTLELFANEETWICVTIDDKDAKERLLKPGSRIKWNAKNNFSLRVGNAGGIRVFYNGKDIGPLGEKGKVVKLNFPSLNLSTSRKNSSNVL